jgi:hypothetical protein
LKVAISESWPPPPQRRRSALHARSPQRRPRPIHARAHEGYERQEPRPAMERPRRVLEGSRVHARPLACGRPDARRVQDDQARDERPIYHHENFRCAGDGGDRAQPADDIPLRRARREPRREARPSDSQGHARRRSTDRKRRGAIDPSRRAARREGHPGGPALHARPAARSQSNASAGAPPSRPPDVVAHARARATASGRHPRCRAL